MTGPSVDFGENLTTTILVIKELGRAAAPAKALVEGGSMSGKIPLRIGRHGSAAKTIPIRK